MVESLLCVFKFGFGLLMLFLESGEFFFEVLCLVVLMIELIENLLDGCLDIGNILNLNV